LSDVEAMKSADDLVGFVGVVGVANGYCLLPGAEVAWDLAGLVGVVELKA
jgi:hypothetical protein